MKKIYKLSGLFLVGMLFVASCQEDKVDMYTGPQAINMAVEGDGTFLLTGTDQEKTINLTLSVQAGVSGQPRVIKLGYGKEQTAKENVDFKLPMEIVLAAGKLDTTVRCTIYKAGLTEEPKYLHLVVAPSQDFDGSGVNGEALVKLMLGYPSAWVPDNFWLGYSLGKCTQAKYKFVYEQLGTVDLSNYADMGPSMDLANRLNEILESDPRTDDDGSTMRFGNGY